MEVGVGWLLWELLWCRCRLLPSRRHLECTLLIWLLGQGWSRNKLTSTNIIIQGNPSFTGLCSTINYVLHHVLFLSCVNSSLPSKLFDEIILNPTFLIYSALWHKASCSDRSCAGHWIHCYGSCVGQFLLVLCILLSTWRSGVWTDPCSGKWNILDLTNMTFQGNVSVQQYFLTRRGTANGIFMSGGAIGNMLMPIILR